MSKETEKRLDETFDALVKAAAAYHAATTLLDEDDLLPDCVFEMLHGQVYEAAWNYVQADIADDEAAAD